MELNSRLIWNVTGHTIIIIYVCPNSIASSVMLTFLLKRQIMILGLNVHADVMCSVVFSSP